jgi:hypothetical protein
MELPRHLMLGGAIAMYDAQRLGNARGPSVSALADVIDAMGELSARAQFLAAPISTAQKLHANPGQRLYLMFDAAAHAAVGLLKVGPKHLFITEGTKQHEIEPLCVLDFYVHESRQRAGCGLQLFEEMLRAEGVEPHRLGYDRPSPKLMGFLRKHYSLSRFTPQANNFVVFADFFASGARQLGSRRGHQAAAVVPAPASRPEQRQAVRGGSHSGSHGGGSCGGPERAGDGGGSDATAWAHAAAVGGSASPVGTPGSERGQRRSGSRGGATVVSSTPGTQRVGRVGAQCEPEPEPQQWLSPAGTANGFVVDERTRQAREAALLSLTKAAANCATAGEEDVRELGKLVEEALHLGLTQADNVMQMATNLRRGRSSVSYFVGAWRAKLKDEQRQQRLVPR